MPPERETPRAPAVPVLRHPQRKALPHVEVKGFVFQFMVNAPRPAAGHHCKHVGTHRPGTHLWDIYMHE